MTRPIPTGLAFAAAALMWSAVVGCASNGTSMVLPACEEGALTCAGLDALECRGGVTQIKQTCPEACMPGLGCTCLAGRRRCATQGLELQECSANGQWVVIDTADVQAGEQCGGGDDPHILTECEVAELLRTSEGCTFWPTVTPNLSPKDNPYTGIPTSWDGFHFAVVVTNSHDTPVDVSIDRGGLSVRDVTIPPRSVETITLPWVRSLLNAATVQVVAAGAYRLVSSRPVTVVQANPIEYVSRAGESPVYTYSNDSSLLYPQNALGTEYRVLSFPTIGEYTYPRQRGAVVDHARAGFFAVVATEDDTEIEVKFAGLTGMLRDGGAGYLPGNSARVTLDAGDVYFVPSPNSQRLPPPEPVEEYCGPVSPSGSRHCLRFDRRYDLTGSTVTSTRPVAVFGGHACANVGGGGVGGWGRDACDHLETQILPTRALANEAIGASLWAPVDEYPTMWRIVSASTEANEITFDPPIHAPVVIQPGEFFDVEHLGGIYVRGTGRLILAQVLPGAGGADDALGDPALAIMPPPAQFRVEHRFLVAPGWSESTFQIIAPLGVEALMLDGTALTATLTRIGSTSYGYVNLPIAVGPHTLETMGGRAGVSVLLNSPYASLLYTAATGVEPID